MFFAFVQQTDRRQDSNTKTLEKELADLSNRIAKHEVDLSRYRSAGRRMRGAVTLYGVLAFVAYLAVWALFFARDRSDTRLWVERAAPVIVIPSILYLVRAALDLFWGRRVDGAETALEALRTQQRDKVEQFKTKTDFYTTKSLIDRYESPKGKSGASEGKEAKANTTPRRSQPTSQQGTPKNTPQRQVLQKSLEGTTPTPQRLSGVGAVQRQLPAQHAAEQSPPPPSEPVPQFWYDRVLDVIVGEDDSQPTSRFQLERKVRERDERIQKMELEMMKLKAALAEEHDKGE